MLPQHFALVAFFYFFAGFAGDRVVFPTVSVVFAGFAGDRVVFPTVSVVFAGFVTAPGEKAAFFSPSKVKFFPALDIGACFCYNYCV